MVPIFVKLCEIHVVSANGSNMIQNLYLQFCGMVQDTINVHNVLHMKDFALQYAN